MLGLSNLFEKPGFSGNQNPKTFQALTSIVHHSFGFILATEVIKPKTGLESHNQNR